MRLRWAGLVVIAAALLIGDQIRLKRPDHKYRLTIEIETPGGLRTASGVMAVHPDRSYSGSGSVGTRTKGDALFVDLGGGRDVVVLLTHDESDRATDSMNYLALRAFNAAGQRVQFRDLKNLSGTVALAGELIPAVVSFVDRSDPKTARRVKPDGFDAVFGPGTRLRGMSVTMVPNGLWPLDFGGALGEPVTREIESKLPWLKGPNPGAAIALEAAGLTTTADPADAFTRK